MCLYDGANASSNGITLTFSDDASGTVGRAPEDFSIFRNGGNRSSINDRLDYLVSIANPVTGSQEQVKNGVATYWSYGANAKKRTQQVVLPGVPGVSLCIPAPITISTPSVDISGKSSGNYSGVLRVIYTPSTYTK
jgi:CblD like pilus biogenesis initiator.